MPDHGVRCNLTVIRSTDIERAARFYRALGLTLSLHSHGGGPAHYAHERDGHTFEIYPLADGAQATSSTRIGFAVALIDETIVELLSAGGRLVQSPSDSPWGRRAIVMDPDGHRVELTAHTRADATV